MLNMMARQSFDSSKIKNDEAKELLIQMLKFNPEERPTMHEIMVHECFNMIFQSGYYDKYPKWNVSMKKKTIEQKIPNIYEKIAESNSKNVDFWNTQYKFNVNDRIKRGNQERVSRMEETTKNVTMNENPNLKNLDFPKTDLSKEQEKNTRVEENSKRNNERNEIFDVKSKNHFSEHSQKQKNQLENKDRSFNETKKEVRMGSFGENQTIRNYIPNSNNLEIRNQVRILTDFESKTQQENNKELEQRNHHLNQKGLEIKTQQQKSQNSEFSNQENTNNKPGSNNQLFFSNSEPQRSYFQLPQKPTFEFQTGIDKHDKPFFNVFNNQNQTTLAESIAKTCEIKPNHQVLVQNHHSGETQLKVKIEEENHQFLNDNKIESNFQPSHIYKQEIKAWNIILQGNNNTFEIQEVSPNLHAKTRNHDLSLKVKENESSQLVFNQFQLEKNEPIKDTRMPNIDAGIQIIRPVSVNQNRKVFRLDNSSHRYVGEQNENK